MNAGEVRWVDLPPRRGHEQAGHRPAIVFQGAAVSAELPTVLLVPLTTQLDALRFPATVLVEPDAANGLRHPSVALLFQLTAVDRRLVGPRAGAVSGSVMDALWNALRVLAER